MTLRRFQLGVNVFEVDVRGNDLLVGIGKLGRPTLKPRPKASEAEAQAEMDKLVAAHLAKGYVEVDVPPDPEIARTKQREQFARDDAMMKRIEREQLERRRVMVEKIDRCAYTPARDAVLEADDPRVYADWLIERGDPRGTIAATFLQGDHAAADRLCAEYTPIGKIELVDGFAHRASIGGEALADRVSLLCGAGVACTLRELQIGLPDGRDWTPALTAVAASPVAARLEALTFDASDRLVRDPQPGREDELDVLDRLTPVAFGGTPPWSQLTALQRLTIDAPFGGKLGMVSASLQELTIRSLSLHNIDDLLALAKTAPKLRRLGLFVQFLPPDAEAALQKALGKRLVTEGDTREPARYGNIVE